MTSAVPTAPRVRPAKPAATKLRVAAVVAIVLGAVAFLVFKGLGDATVYFKTADEALTEKKALGDRRFRLEGAVVPGTVQAAPGGVNFDVRGTAGGTVEVVHQGDPPELFQPDIPVVLEGRWDGSHYASDRIMVKHTSEYRAENPDRVDTYVGKDRAGGP